MTMPDNFGWGPQSVIPGVPVEPVDTFELPIEKTVSYNHLVDQAEILLKQGQEPADVIMALNVIAAEIAVYYIYQVADDE